VNGSGGTRARNNVKAIMEIRARASANCLIQPRVSLRLQAAAAIFLPSILPRSRITTLGRFLFFSSVSSYLILVNLFLLR